MTTPTVTKTPIHKASINPLQIPKSAKLAVAYFFFMIVPFVMAQLLGMEIEGLYTRLLSAVNLVAMSAFFLQFPLAGRIKPLPLFANIDWGITKHKQFGQYLGVFFFLHPILILLPKAMMSFDDFSVSFVSAITSQHLLTGMLAWLAMAVWVLMSVLKDKLNITYETWRLLHVIGFSIIATLATLHITTVGSHGQYNQQFNVIWWLLYTVCMTLIVYNYVIKPRFIKQHPYAISHVEKINECDWQINIAPTTSNALAYQPGQFVWLNTTGNPYSVEQHPFSIVQGAEQGQLGFIIRALGDYTSSLEQLTVGQTVFVDGPYGSLTLDQSQLASGITLIAGGAGIAPMLSLLRQLEAQQDPRPIRLLYANRNQARMVYVDELVELEKSMSNFKVKLICEQLNVHDESLPRHLVPGLINQTLINTTMTTGKESQWSFYICGPKGMISATTTHLHQLGITQPQIHFEQLAF
ncbi:ferredoxin reductase family protein [Shewanella metallivivens]|uniref:Ferric reductase-like transmembrane domain-containing protein n=1 Tax=Shewanella metallivivens TaxID=2872342 RepID=A0ABT5TIK3_9GAMM|nr:FAD-binding oxidoreductase [Shewanella metallivivens]MDD8058384.1 ferric reductase-like transmembrane domain-containing protein [Shewanella metallivivens]